MQPQDQTNDQSLNNSLASTDNTYVPPPLPPELTPLDEPKSTPSQPQGSSAPKLGAQNEGVVAPQVQATPVKVDKPQAPPPVITNHSAPPQATTPQPVAPMPLPAEPQPIPQAQPVLTTGPPKFTAPTTTKEPEPKAIPSSPINPTVIKPNNEPRIEPVLNPAEPIVDTPADIIKSAKPTSDSVKYIEPVLAPDPNKMQAESSVDLSSLAAQIPAASPTVGATPTNWIGSKLKVIIIGVVALIVLVGGLSIYMMLAGKNGNGNGKNNGPVANVPEGYQLVDRDCFSFPMFNLNIQINESSTCYVLGSYGERGQNKLNVYPETRQRGSVAEYAAAKKQQYNTKELESTAAKIDGFDAIKVTENVGGATSEINVRYYVLTGGKDYKYQGIPVFGFEIQAYYNDDASRNAVDTSITNWKWK